MENIFLNDILNIEFSDYCNWTICLNNANDEGIYSFDENPKRLLEHISWKKHAKSNVSFRNINTKFCLQFIRLDKENKFNQWLFLGAFIVNGYKEHKGTGLLCWSKKDGANLRRLLIYIAFRRGLFRNCLYKSNPQ